MVNHSLKNEDTVNNKESIKEKVLKKIMQLRSLIQFTSSQPQITEMGTEMPKYIELVGLEVRVRQSQYQNDQKPTTEDFESNIFFFYLILFLNFT